MNTYKKSGILLLFAGILVMSSCKKFLEEAPSKTSSLLVKTTDQLNDLLNNYNRFYDEINRTNTSNTDDYGLTVDIYDARRGSFSNMPNIQYMLWDTEFLPDATREAFWAGEYSKIFNANLVLDQLDKVTGSAQDKATLKADAHFIRAYSYWQLANTYCLPYNEASKNELGLPLKLTTSFEEPVQRQPLYKIYDQIESDLAEALKTTVLLNTSGVARTWRASKPAVHAFAARYYLNRNDNAKALEYANLVLTAYNTLVDYNTQMKYGVDEVYTIVKNGVSQSATVKFPYTHDNQVSTNPTDALGWKEFLYFRVLTNEVAWNLPSQDLLNLYDKEHDLRYKYHAVMNFSYTKSMTNPAFEFPGYIFFYNDKLPSGPTVAEVLLTKAEAQARLNDPAGAMATLNILRAKRMTAGAWVNLTASDRADAIKKVAEERRREMPFVQRWFDIRRYNNNEETTDDVVLTKTFYPYNGSSVLFNEPVKTYTLPVGSRRWATPIPRADIISSNGIIVQNTY